MDLDHMTKMATMPIYGKNPSLQELGMQHRELGSTKFDQMMTLG